MVSRGSAAEICVKEYRVFNRNDVVASGWYWLLPANAVKRKSVRAVNVFGYELAVYRGNDGQVVALDAYCPHMGAHLAEGKVEGNQLRCFFHNWCFDAEGACTDIPCLNGTGTAQARRVRTKSWYVQERHGLIWVWLGEEEPTEPIPAPPELAGTDYEYSLGNRFWKNCHPNVVMINAIDEQHFQTVHRLPGHVLSMEPAPLTGNHIEFRNSGNVPRSTRLGRWLKSFYKNSLTYKLDYWYGSTGTVNLGPDFLPLYLMFTLRLTADGKTEGYAIAFTRRRKGPLHWCFNRLVLLLTQLAGLYFASGDTRVFQTIRFNLHTPIAADRAVLAFIQHLEKQHPFERASK